MNEAEIKQKILQLEAMISNHKRQQGGGGSAPAGSHGVHRKPPPAVAVKKVAAALQPVGTQPIVSIIKHAARHESVKYVNNRPVSAPSPIPVHVSKKSVSSPPQPPSPAVFKGKPLALRKRMVGGGMIAHPNSPYMIPAGYNRYPSSSFNISKTKFPLYKNNITSSYYRPSPVKVLSSVSSSPFRNSGASIKSKTLDRSLSQVAKKVLNDQYILIGNKLIRSDSITKQQQESLLNKSSPSATPTTTTTKITGKTRVNPPANKIKKTNTTNPRKPTKKGLLDKIRDKLSSKKKKENCLFFNRFGKCNKGSECDYEHDKEKVRTCPKYLSEGGCNDSNCTLKHKATDIEQMPVCYQYLKGICVNDNCPYLHVNVSKDAKICQNFLKGHCPYGSTCKLKHTYSKDKTDNNSNNNSHNDNEKKNNNNNNNNNVNRIENHQQPQKRSNDSFFEEFDNSLFS